MVIRGTRLFSFCRVRDYKGWTDDGWVCWCSVRDYPPSKISDVFSVSELRKENTEVFKSNLGYGCGVLYKERKLFFPARNKGF